MENSMIHYYKAIGAIQNVISNATVLDEALRGCLKAIVENAGADSAVIWYADKAGDNTLHPFFWIGPVDLTSRSHVPGDGAVGRVFESQKAERIFEFDPTHDVETAIDFKGMPVSSMICVPFSNNVADLGIIAGLVLGCLMGSITVLSMEPSAASFVKNIDLVAVLIGIIGSIVLAAVMSIISLRRIPKFELTDINRF